MTQKPGEGEVAYPALPIEPKSHTDPFRAGGVPAPFHLGDFWTWGCSELTSNVFRGVLAEFLVAKALGITDRPRVEWAPWDLETKDGVRIEVKSASPYQTWGQGRPSGLRFAMGPTTAWDDERGVYEKEKRRQAQVYVFAVLNRHGSKESTDPLDLDQWEFFIVPTKILDQQYGDRTGIPLSELENTLHIAPVPWSGIAARIAEVSPATTS